ncbi:MAG: hypothetical protein ACC661_06420, partial [Verrucomicrobiales bacterium]
MRILKALPLAVLVALAGSLNVGCIAIGESSASIASVSSISASSSAIVAANPTLRDDIAMASATAVQAGATSPELLRAISRVAAEHGVSDWEAEESAFFAIGLGLRQGG